MKNTKLHLLLPIAIFFLACSKDESGPITENNLPTDPIEGVLVLNEGSFGSNNASVSFLKTNGEVSNNVFEAKNDRLLGDVLQSVTEGTDDYYLVVNNSAKIERVNKYSLESKATITGFQSPRYMQPIGNGKALVTNLVFNTGPSTIDVVNLQTNTITGSIATEGSSEEMVLFGSRVYVANTNMDRVLVIDVTQMSVVESISVPSGPVTMTLDKNNKIWVTGHGNFTDGYARMVRIDPATNSVEATLDFSDPKAYPGNLKINMAGDQLLYLASGSAPGVYRMSITATETPVSPLIAFNTGFAYGLGVDPETDNIYVADAKDFFSAGRILIYNANGKQINEKEVGVVPSGFSFR